MWGCAAWIGFRYHGAFWPGRPSSARRRYHIGDGDDDDDDEDVDDDDVTDDAGSRIKQNQ